MFKDWFNRKKTNKTTMPSEKSCRDIPEGIMIKCVKCGTIQFARDLDKNLKVCHSCGYHYKLTGPERLEMLLDDGEYEELDGSLSAEDPLAFPAFGQFLSYRDKLAKHKETSGLVDAIVTGKGKIGGYPVVVSAMSFAFFGGSMGSVVGEKIARAVEYAVDQNIPFILFSSSGGARMEESIFSLMQMAKTSAALKRLDEAKLLYISVLTDPTTGGVTASYAMLGDINIAEPGAIIGFAGRRVIEQTIRQKLPDDFQTAEFNLQHGQLDLVLPRKDMRQLMTRLLEMHVK